MGNVNLPTSHASLSIFQSLSKFIQASKFTNCFKTGKRALESFIRLFPTKRKRTPPNAPLGVERRMRVARGETAALEREVEQRAAVCALRLKSETTKVSHLVTFRTWFKVSPATPPPSARREASGLPPVTRGPRSYRFFFLSLSLFRRPLSSDSVKTRAPEERVKCARARVARPVPKEARSESISNHSRELLRDTHKLSLSLKGGGGAPFSILERVWDRNAEPQRL